MKFLFRKKSLLMTFVIYSCIIFIIPTVILLARIYSSDVVNRKEQIENECVEYVQSLNTSVEKNFYQLDTIAIKISQDQKTSKYYMNGSLVQEMDGISRIKQYKEFSEFADDILVYFKNDDFIYSSDGRSNFDTMFNLIYQYPANVRYEVIDHIKRTEEPLMLPMCEIMVRGVDKHYVATYIYPIQNVYEKLDLTVAFVISEQSIINQIKQNYNADLGEVFLLNSENQVVTSTGNMLEKSELTPKFFTKLKDKEITTVSHEHEKYIITGEFLGTTGLKIVLVAKEETLFQEVAVSRISLLVIMGILIFLCVSLIFIVAFNYYNSISRLKNKMNLSEISFLKSGSEIDQIISWMDSVIEQKEKIKTEYQFKHREVRNKILEMFLKGEIRNVNDFNELTDSDELDFIRNFFSVVVITPVDTSLKLHGDWHTIESTFTNTHGLRLLDFVYDNSVVIIATGDTEEQVKDLEEQIVELIEELYPEKQIKLGIGKIYRDTSCLSNSFYEAQIAVDNVVNKNDNLLRYNDILFEKRGVTYWTMNEEQVKFIQCVKYGNLEGAKINLNIMLESILSMEDSYIYRNLAYLDIINMLVKTLKSNNILIEQETIAELSNLKNMDHIKEKLEQVMEKSFAKRKSSQEVQDNQIINSIFVYINENYCNSNISLEHVADHFGVTTHFLSRFIKENLNVSFTDLLVKLRMDHFKRLLVETDGPIKDLIAEIGYLDTSSFVRKFKKMEGMTPGAYRKMMKND